MQVNKQERLKRGCLNPSNLGKGKKKKKEKIKASFKPCKNKQKRERKAVWNPSKRKIVKEQKKKSVCILETM